MHQVNIPAAQRATIKGMLTTDKPVCTSDMFDKAHTEIFRLMSRDPFPRFLKSDLAITFAKIAKIQDVTGEVKQDDNDEEPSSGKPIVDSGRSGRPKELKA